LAGNVGTTLTGTYGTLNLAANGTWTYTLNDADTDTQALAGGAAATDVFSYTMQDASSAQSTTTLTVNITGADDGPTGINFQLIAVSDNGSQLNAGRTIGAFLPIGDPDGGPVITSYSITDDPSEPGTDNTLFTISGNQLLVGGSNLSAGTYGIIVHATVGTGPGSFTVDLPLQVQIGSAGGDTLNGGPGNTVDIIYGLNGDDIINGTITGSGGSDALIGGQNNDTIRGGAGDDTIVGADNDLLLNGEADTDTLVILVDFNDPNDALIQNIEKVLLSEVSGLDLTLDAQSEGFDITGSSFGDNIVAGSGTDTIKGGGGTDNINGGGGNDTLDGGAGNDTLTGGTGNDNFLFSLTTNGVDTILSFSVADDTIQFDNASFTAIGPDGTLAATAFHIGTLATQDGTDRITYDNTTGALYYDADGSGVVSAAIQIAQMATGLAMTNNDIQVI
jgi:VCBS repeat-containing protein